MRRFELLLKEEIHFSPLDKTHELRKAPATGLRAATLHAWQKRTKRSNPKEPPTTIGSIQKRTLKNCGFSQLRPVSGSRLEISRDSRWRRLEAMTPVF
jgi:hypothetical protein